MLFLNETKFKQHFALEDIVINSGNQGTVTKITERKTGVKYALKTTLCYDDTEKQNAASFELLLSSGSHHKNIMRPIAYTYLTHATQNLNQQQNYNYPQISERMSLNIVMELGTHDLQQHISQNMKCDMLFDKNQLQPLLCNLISALSELQTKKIAHKYIKPENIVYANGEYKIIDFGMAGTTTEGEYSNDYRGTAAFVSPLLALAINSNFQEFHSHNVYKSDVYSLALTFIHAATNLSIDGMNKPNGQSLTQKRLLDVDKYEYYDRWFLELLYEMSNHDETKRPDFKQLKEFIDKTLNEGKTYKQNNENVQINQHAKNIAKNNKKPSQQQLLDWSISDFNKRKKYMLNLKPNPNKDERRRKTQRLIQLSKFILDQSTNGLKISSVLLLSQSRLLVLGFEDGSIEIRNSTNLSYVIVKKVVAHQGAIKHLEEYLSSPGVDGKILVWMYNRIYNTLESNQIEAPPFALIMKFVPIIDQSVMICGYKNNLVKIFLLRQSRLNQIPILDFYKSCRLTTQTLNNNETMQLITTTFKANREIFIIVIGGDEGSIWTIEIAVPLAKNQKLKYQMHYRLSAKAVGITTMCPVTIIPTLTNNLTHNIICTGSQSSTQEGQACTYNLDTKDLLQKLKIDFQADLNNKFPAFPSIVEMKNSLHTLCILDNRGIIHFWDQQYDGQKSIKLDKYEACDRLSKFQQIILGQDRQDHYLIIALDTRLILYIINFQS